MQHHHMNTENRGRQLAVNNECYYTLHGYPISFVLGYCIAAAPDPARKLVCKSQNCNSSNLILVKEGSMASHKFSYE